METFSIPSGLSANRKFEPASQSQSASLQTDSFDYTDISTLQVELCRLSDNSASRQQNLQEAHEKCQVPAVPACLLTLGKRPSRNKDWLPVRSNMHCFERLRLMVSCLCACARNTSDHENRPQGGRAALDEVLLARTDIHGEVSTGL
jgi:hypothetical protein